MSFQHLSLQRCYIGDAGCELLCRKVVDVHSVRSRNLSQCELTSEAGQSLASALSRQILSLYNGAWNRKLGNDAAKVIIEEIRDSLWFKALDSQQCGLSEPIITGDILELLDHNKTLVIVNMRSDSALRNDNLAVISRRLDRNELRAKSEYRWLSLPQTKESTAVASK